MNTLNFPYGTGGMAITSDAGGLQKAGVDLAVIQL
jgi:hypothetical protein